MDEFTKTTKLIAVYARVSTARQEEDGTIETQLSAVREFAKKNGYNIVQEYIDNGWSGDILARPQLDQLRQDAKGKIWEGVLIYDPDRLARRYSYQELLMDELREARIEVLFVTTPTPKNGEDKILHGVKGLFAEYERAKITERFRLGKLRKVKEGHVINSEAPYGYAKIRNSEKGPGYYEINPEEARVVKMVYSWVADGGLTIRGVAKKLLELGIRPRKSKRGVWSTSTLSHLLKNKSYIGEAYYGRSQAVVPDKPLKIEKYRKMRKTSRRFRPEEEWIKIPVPPILDTVLFERAQIKLKENFELSNRHRKNDYLLAGKIWCECGNRRTGEGPQRGKHLYYRCIDRIRRFPLPNECVERGINAKIADKLIWSRIAKLMGSPELLFGQIKRWVANRQNKQTSAHIDHDFIVREIAKLKSEEDRYNKAYGAGLISIEQLKEYTTPIRSRASSAEVQLAKYQEENNQINEAVLPNSDEVAVFTDKVAKTLRNLNFEAKRAIIINIIDKVVGTKQELRVYGFIPVENTTNYVGYKTLHRYRGFAKCRQINFV